MKIDIVLKNWNTNAIIFPICQEIKEKFMNR